MRKGCHNLVIENISDVTGDDAVALTAYRDPLGSSTSSRPPRRRKAAETAARR